MAKIIDIEGIGQVYAQKLQQAGIKTTDALLKVGSTDKGRKELAEKTGLSDQLILRWVNHADLFRIKGVGPEYSDLLECAGVDTVVELAQRNAGNLYTTLLAANEEKKLVRRPPVEAQVKDWIKQAKKLPRVVNY